MKMIKIYPMILILVMMVVPLFGCAQSEPEPVPELERISIPELKGEETEKYTGQRVIVEGIFIRDPVPMLVTQLDFVLINRPLPEREHILITGKEAEKIDPSKLGGGTLQVTGTVEIGEGEDGFPYVALAEIEYVVLVKPLEPYYPYVQEIETVRQHLLFPEKYAVLFSGGFNAGNNYVRYWNDLKFMYTTLVNTLGFPADNVTVLYADGTGRDNDVPVDFSATQANLDLVLNGLRETAIFVDTIFIFTTNHGGGFDTSEIADPIFGGQVDTNNDEQGDVINEQTFTRDLDGDGNWDDVVAWDESLYSWGGEILDDDFSAMLADLNFSKMIVVMEQCFSGGMILDMTVGGDQIIMAAAGEYRPSYAMADGVYDEFSYYFTSAINHADPDGNPVDADLNNDGMVSIVEAFNYAEANDTRNETPHYEDSGDGMPETGTMPSGNDGTLGETTTLDP